MTRSALPSLAPRPRLARLAPAALLALAAACAPGLSPLGLGSGAEDPWEATVDRVSRAVVSLRVTTPRAFDTDTMITSGGTGVVVDAARGLILTNRHMVHPGPVVAEAVFLNHEEVPVRAIYRDPVHDFGFFQFDPERVRYMDLVDLPMVPAAARVGAEIRVIGNDAGEKLSILAGTIARLDRAAPNYGSATYNDFNTFYYQAASNTSGGSSGSPVVDVQGRIVALNAGGRREAASSYYLPLHRVVRAYERIVRGQPVERGTLQTTFEHVSYDELRRLGLREPTEAGARAAEPDLNGMLVVGRVVPLGPADGQLRPGDILTRVDGRLLLRFEDLEAVLDESVGREVRLEIERGGDVRTVTLTVGDLHAITPAEYVELGGGVVHALSYQRARNHNVPVEGLYVPELGYAMGEGGLEHDAVIRTVDEVPVPDLDSFWREMTGKAPRERVRLRYTTLTDSRRERVAVFGMDRRWFPMKRCRRDDDTGTWPCESAPPPPAPVPPEPATTQPTGPDAGPARTLARSLVRVEVGLPYRLEGVGGQRYNGAGLVVDAGRGLVVTDRETAPILHGDASIVFASSVRTEARVRYVHPIHNFAVLQYDPAAIGDTPMRSARLREGDLDPGDDLWQVVLDEKGRIRSREATVSRVAAAGLGEPGRPRYQQTNADLVELETSKSSIGGVLATDAGEVVALWASFYRPGSNASALSRGLPAHALTATVEALRAGREPAYRSLGVELVSTTLVQARDLGLPEEAARELERQAGASRQVLMVRRIYGGAPARALLDEGDLLLAVEGEPATSFAAVERAVQGHERVVVTVARDGETRDLSLPTQLLGGRGVDRFMMWAGAVVHQPHLELATQRGLPRAGVYVASYWRGSPAARYGLRATRRITEVDGKAVGDLDDLEAAVAGLGDGDPVRVRTTGLDGRDDTLTLKLDTRYWPTLEFVHGEDGWARVPSEP